MTGLRSARSSTSGKMTISISHNSSSRVSILLPASSLVSFCSLSSRPVSSRLVSSRLVSSPIFSSRLSSASLIYLSSTLVFPKSLIRLFPSFSSLLVSYLPYALVSSLLLSPSFFSSLISSPFLSSHLLSPPFVFCCLLPSPFILGLGLALDRRKNFSEKNKMEKEKAKEEVRK
jgi:hypothetical protein